MKCIACSSYMKCVDDVNEVGARIDWLECPKCKSTAEVHFGNNGEYKSKVIWKR